MNSDSIVTNLLFYNHPLVKEIYNIYETGSDDSREFFNLYDSCRDLSCVKDANGNTLIHFLASIALPNNGLHAYIVSEILSRPKGMDIEDKNNDGLNAYEITRVNGNLDEHVIEPFHDYTLSAWGINPFGNISVDVEFPITRGYEVSTVIVMDLIIVARSEHYDVSGQIISFYDKVVSDEHWNLICQTYREGKIFDAFEYVANAIIRRSNGETVYYKDLMGVQKYFGGIHYEIHEKYRVVLTD